MIWLSRTINTEYIYLSKEKKKKKEKKQLKRHVLNLFWYNLYVHGSHIQLINLQDRYLCAETAVSIHTRVCSL